MIFEKEKLLKENGGVRFALRAGYPGKRMGRRGTIHALQLCPDNAQILNNFGNTRLALGDYTGANEYFMRSIAHDPKQADARLNAAVCKLTTGPPVGASMNGSLD
jgi:hypothetical protein